MQDVQGKGKMYMLLESINGDLVQWNLLFRNFNEIYYLMAKVFYNEILYENIAASKYD